MSISIAEGFVLILLTYRIEHKDYAISYQSAVRCTLSMPDNLRVSISGGGHYEVSMGDEGNNTSHVRETRADNIDVISATATNYVLKFIIKIFIRYC